MRRKLVYWAGIYMIRVEHHRRRARAWPHLAALTDMGDLAMHYLLFGRMGGW